MSQVLCGSALEVLKTLPENSVDCVFTAPSPFGYYENNPERIGGESRPKDYIENIILILKECNRVLKKSGNLFIQMGDKFDSSGSLMGIPTVFEYYVRQEHFILRDRLIWHRTEKKKNNYNDYGFLKNYEYIFHFVKSIDFYFNRNSKYTKTSVFSYPLEDTYFTNEFDSGLPTELTKMVLDTTCPPNGTVLDPLAGSGKVGVIAKKMNRNYILIEIDPPTADLIRIRLER